MPEPLAVTQKTESDTTLSSIQTGISRRFGSPLLFVENSDAFLYGAENHACMCPIWSPRHPVTPEGPETSSLPLSPCPESVPAGGPQRAKARQCQGLRESTEDSAVCSGRCPCGQSWALASRCPSPPQRASWGRWTLSPVYAGQEARGHFPKASVSCQAATVTVLALGKRSAHLARVLTR